MDGVNGPSVEVPGWLDELGLDADGPPWLAMGLSRLDPADWLIPDEQRSDELAERHRLLSERPDEVFAALPGTEAAGEEVVLMVRTWFAEHRPGVVLPEDPPAIHPLEAAGRLVQEDLCLMVRHSDVHHLDAACLCFPSHWRLADKLGRPASALHGPVPRYDTELASRVDRYLDRLRPDALSRRRNWSVHDAPDLFAPWPPAAPRRLEAGDVATGLWLRSERQTLRRLPRTGAVLFAIRVQQAPFGVLAGRPDVATRFAARLASQPAELTAMNGLDGYRDAVLGWLDRITDGGEPPPRSASPLG
jgi:hypothetical protein